MLAAQSRNAEVFPPPRTTALGSLCWHLSREQDDFQPSNVVWSMFPPHAAARLGKRDRHLALAQRALEDLNAWLPKIGRSPIAATTDIPDPGNATPAPVGESGFAFESADESEVMRPFVKLEDAP
jgi:hypothetical protein